MRKLAGHDNPQPTARAQPHGTQGQPHQACRAPETFCILGGGAPPPSANSGGTEESPADESVAIK